MQVRTALLLVAVLDDAQSDLPREVLNLARIKAKMRESLDLAPHYTCTAATTNSARTFLGHRHCFDSALNEQPRDGECDPHCASDDTHHREHWFARNEIE